VGKIHIPIGIPPEWFQHEHGMLIENLPTHFGRLNVKYRIADKTATLTLTGTAAPPGGFVLRTEPAVVTRASADGKPLSRAENGDVAIPQGSSVVTLILR
jgi:hypothetical protein